MGYSNYSNDLLVLLNQQADNLEVKYGPTSQLAEREENMYYRVYTDTRNPTPPEISQPLSIPLYTREMKTAIMKRWLEINSPEETFEPKFDIGVYLSKAEQYSTLFHLFELGDKNADVENTIKNELGEIIDGNKDFETFIDIEPSILSFKYLSDKLNGRFTEPRKGELIGLTDELLKQARNTIVYEDKRKLVDDNLTAFREFTRDPLHFDFVKDLDYFFLVFESFIPVVQQKEAGKAAEAAEGVAAGEGEGVAVRAAGKAAEAGEGVSAGEGAATAAREAEEAARVAAKADAAELADRKALEELASQKALEQLQRVRVNDLPQGEKHQKKKRRKF